MVITKIIEIICFYILRFVCYVLVFAIRLMGSVLSRAYDVIHLLGKCFGKDFPATENYIYRKKNSLMGLIHSVNHFPYAVRYRENIKNYYPKILPKGASMETFLSKLYEGESFIRYGDGEEVLMLTNEKDKNIDVYFQSFNTAIKSYLILGLNNQNPHINILITRPIKYIAHRKNKHIKASNFYSKEFFDLYANVKNRCGDDGQVINACVIRAIYNHKPSKLKLQKYLLNKKIILICNQFVYDNLMANLFLPETNLIPIIIPPTNVWDKREQVLQQVEQTIENGNKSDFVVLSMAGMTSIYFVIETLEKFGIQAVDFGQPYIATIKSSHQRKKIYKTLKS